MSVGPEQIAALVAEARTTPLRRARICLHPDTSDVLHEMVIALCRDTYVAPHQHATKTESFHLLAGEIDVVIFDDEGRIIECHRLSADDPQRPRLMRLQRSVWHSVIVRTEWAVVHETTNGPFRREETIFAPWNPAPTDIEAVERFHATLRAARVMP